jgi:hypothetical protein
MSSRRRRWATSTEGSSSGLFTVLHRPSPRRDGAWAPGTPNRPRLCRRTSAGLLIYRPLAVETPDTSIEILKRTRQTQPESVEGPDDAAESQRALSPADATVFIRLVGSIHAEVEEGGISRTKELDGQGT